MQDLPLADRFPVQRLFERVAEQARGWNVNDNLGLVVGATHPEALAAVRKVAPDLWILAPGVGAQGGDLDAALRAGLRTDGLGLLVPISRQISRAADPRRAAMQLVEAMRNERENNTRAFSGIEPSGGFVGHASSRLRPQIQDDIALSPAAAALADRLLDAGCVRFGEFTLKSGLQSPIYLDLRQLISDPALLGAVGAAYTELLRGLKFDRLAALPYAALPIATAISLRGGWPMIYPRKEAKSYGTGAEIEGAFRAGERAAIIDDLATTGGSKFEAIAKLAAAGLRIEDVVVLIDRRSGAAEALAAAGYRLHAVMTLPRMLDHWERTGQVPAEQIAATRAFVVTTSVVPAGASH